MKLNEISDLAIRTQPLDLLLSCDQSPLKLRTGVGSSGVLLQQRRLERLRFPSGLQPKPEQNGGRDSKCTNQSVGRHGSTRLAASGWRMLKRM